MSCRTRLGAETRLGKANAGRGAIRLLKALEERVGDEVEGTVVERMGAACLVLLDTYPLKVFVPPQREAWATPGDQIRLSVAQVSARRDLVRVERPLRVP